MMWGGELVLRDGRPAGQVTSAAWGETLGGSVGLACVWSEDVGPVALDWVRGGSYQANVGGRLVPISVSTRPLYDPDNERLQRPQGS
jgi:4-methylaminobutanoate oxidase (formaldehyde-forming)